LYHTIIILRLHVNLSSRFLNIIFRLSALFVFLSGLYGCNFTVQSYNHGKLLNPGEGMVTTGLGWKQRDLIESTSSYGYTDPETGDWIYSSGYDTTTFDFFSFAWDFRLGFLEKYPFGKGMEIGFHLEEAISRTREFDYDENEYVYSPVIEGPPVIELSSRFGLPDRIMGSSIWHHNIELGWIIGGWVDNGWFGGYSAGLERKHILPYASVRVLLTPTDVLNSSFSFDDQRYFTQHDQHIQIRTALGISLKLRQLPVLPDIIAPEISILAPHYQSANGFGMTLHVGLRWMNGI
jgi:hypothetical protein